MVLLQAKFKNFTDHTNRLNIRRGFVLDVEIHNRSGISRISHNSTDAKNAIGAVHYTIGVIYNIHGYAPDVMCVTSQYISGSVSFVTVTAVRLTVTSHKDWCKAPELVHCCHVNIC